MENDHKNELKQEISKFNQKYKNLKSKLTKYIDEFLTNKKNNGGEAFDVTDFYLNPDKKGFI